MPRVLFTVLAAVILAGGAAAAHHSYSAYHVDLVIQIDGELEAVEWVNPHSLLKVRTNDAFYVVEWRAPNAMLREGIRKDSLGVGDRLIVTGNPRRDLAESGVVNLRTILRPSDGWVWPSR